MANNPTPIEDVLREYARPFIAGGWTTETALAAATAIWDLVNDGLTSEQIVAKLSDDDDPHYAKLVAAFVERKRTLFGSDRRYAHP
jgi:hypothetical protein